MGGVAFPAARLASLACPALTRLTDLTDSRPSPSARIAGRYPPRVSRRAPVHRRVRPPLGRGRRASAPPRPRRPLPRVLDSAWRLLVRAVLRPPHAPPRPTPPRVPHTCRLQARASRTSRARSRTTRRASPRSSSRIRQKRVGLWGRASACHNHRIHFFHPFALTASMRGSVSDSMPRLDVPSDRRTSSWRVETGRQPGVAGS